MESEPYHLYWKNQLVGSVRDVGWDDFPWAGGKLTLAEMMIPELRGVLEYTAAKAAGEDGLHDWPFSDEWMEHWRIVQPDGKSIEICLPVVDFASGYVTWR